MKEFHAETEINGTPETVWALITNAASYPEWDPNMNRIEGNIAEGEQLVLHTKLSKRPFKVTVSELTANQRMAWSSGMPMGLFRGVRTFDITPASDGKVRFRLHEKFTGPLSPVFGRMMPDLQPNFESFVRGLKAEVETQAS